MGEFYCPSGQVKIGIYTWESLHCQEIPKKDFFCGVIGEDLRQKHHLQGKPSILAYLLNKIRMVKVQTMVL